MAVTPMEGDPPPPWTEIGRAAPGNEPWVAWVKQEDPDLTLYRCLILAAGTALVTIDLQRKRAPQMQRLHAGQCPLPPDDQAGHACIAGLLDQADRAARNALSQRSRSPQAAA